MGLAPAWDAPGHALTVRHCEQIAALLSMHMRMIVPQGAHLGFVYACAARNIGYVKPKV